MKHQSIETFEILMAFFKTAVNEASSEVNQLVVEI